MYSALQILTKESQEGNKEAVLAIIKKFSPLIKKYSRKLNYDGADTDLIIALIETIKSIPIDKNELKKEGQIVGYIYVSIKNKYIQLSKKYKNVYKMELPLDVIEIQSLSTEIENDIFINELLDKLTMLQRKVMKKKFIEGISEPEIAKDLRVSTQAVNRIKNRALKKLKDII